MPTTAIIKTITMNHTIRALEWRYAVKAFDPGHKLTEHQIDGIKKVLNLTASSYGLQPFKFIFVDDEDKREQLLAFSFKQRQVIDASHLLIMAIETNVDDSFVEDYLKNISEVRKVELGNLDQFGAMMKGSISNLDQEAKESWAKNQAYIALGNLLTYCAVEGIDTCPMEGFIGNAYDDVLGLNEMGLKSVLVVPLGIRSSDDHHQNLTKVRRDTGDIIKHI